MKKKNIKEYIIGTIIAVLLIALFAYKPKDTSAEYDQMANELRRMGRQQLGEESMVPKTKVITTTKWMCGYCDTLFSVGNILDAFGARICPGCGDIQMTSGESWLFEVEIEPYKEREIENVSVDAFVSESGFYGYSGMILGESKDHVFEALKINVDEIPEMDYKVYTYHSTELFEYDGYELDTYLEFGSDKLRSVSFFWTSNRIKAEKSFDNLAELMKKAYGEPDESIETTLKADAINQKYDSKIMKWKQVVNHKDCILQLTCFDEELSISYAIAQ